MKKAPFRRGFLYETAVQIYVWRLDDASFTNTPAIIKENEFIVIVGKETAYHGTPNYGTSFTLFHKGGLCKTVPWIAVENFKKCLK